MGDLTISRQDIRAAADRIHGYVRETPVLAVEGGALFDGPPVWLKLEQVQHTGSFKVRGAFNALLSQEKAPQAVSAYSGGNHGAAVAFAATNLGMKSTIFCPDFAGSVKINRMRGFGADVRVMDAPASELVEAFQNFAIENGALAIHPYDDAPVLAGQGTLGMEIERQLPEFDTLVLSVGGGGLLGGLGSWFGNRVKIVAVETEGTPTLATALKQGPDAVVNPVGISASALGAGSMGRLAMNVVANTCTVSVVVPDAAVIQAQQRLWDKTRIIGEPGAATALAALTSGAYVPAPEERVCVLVCGGNADPDWFEVAG